MDFDAYPLDSHLYDCRNAKRKASSIMNRIIFVIFVAAIGWYGFYSYKQDGSSFAQMNPSTDPVKCITTDGSVIYGKVPNGTICEKTEAVTGSVTVIPGEKYSKTEKASNSSSSGSNKASSSISRYKCDGRTHCSQMTSCEEAKYFLNNCPSTKMDGNHDGIPCEEQWCR